MHKTLIQQLALHWILPLAVHLFLTELSEIIEHSIVFSIDIDHVYRDRYCYCFITQP